jgi:transposase InsO family protein
VDFARDWSAKAEIRLGRILDWTGLEPRKFRDWRHRYGKANEHNGQVPRDHWLEPAEKEAIVAFFQRHPLEGYRRLTFMMLDQDVAAASPATVYRVLKAAGLLANRWNQPSRKGTGFVQPLRPHEQWHIDFSYVNVGGTFYYLCSVLDGCSRAIVRWEIREAMKEADAELVLQRAREKHPGTTPGSSRTTGRSSCRRTSGNTSGCGRRRTC